MKRKGKLRRRAASILAGAVIVIGGSGGFIVIHGGGGGGGSAAFYVSPSGSDSNNCLTSGAACATLAHALTLATSGQKIELASGTYGTGIGCGTTDTLGANHTLRLTTDFSSTVNFTVASGGTAIIPCAVDLAGDYIGFDATGGTIRVQGIWADGSHNSLTNVDVFCADASPYVLYTVTTKDPSSPNNPAGNQMCTAFLRGNGDNFTMTGGSIGPTTASGPDGLIDSTVGAGQTTSQVTTDWTLNGIRSHDARWTDDCNGGGQSCHTENFYLDAVARFTIKNSTFSNCGDSACVFITRNCCSFDPNNITITGSVFQSGSTPIDAGGTVSAGTSLLTAAYNDFGSGLNLTGGIMTLRGNIGTNNPCPHVGHANASVTYDRNLWWYNTSTGGSADQCGANDVTYNVAHDPLTDIFVDWTNGDYHLKSGTNSAVNLGPTTNCLIASPDYYGTTRFKGSAPDAGAAERTSDAGSGSCSG
jgi:hypothetical protein